MQVTECGLSFRRGRSWYLEQHCLLFSNEILWWVLAAGTARVTTRISTAIPFPFAYVYQARALTTITGWLCDGDALCSRRLSRGCPFLTP
jgi:hypothetical protein